MHRSIRFMLLVVMVLMLSCNNGDLLSQTGDVVIGDEPQQVEDVYAPDPSGYSVEVWQQNLTIPWSLVFLPDDDALVSERPGAIRLIRDGTLMEDP